MPVPKQKPGRSETVVLTPLTFLERIKRHFDVSAFVWDLATEADNPTRALRFYTKEDDALSKSWKDECIGDCWLNPPYDDIEPWAAACVAGYTPQNRIFLLTPASVGSKWFRYYVYPYASVFFLHPRIKFVGHSDRYPKDLMLSVYDRASRPTTVPLGW